MHGFNVADGDGMKKPVKDAWSTSLAALLVHGWTLDIRTRRRVHPERICFIEPTNTGVPALVFDMDIGENGYLL